MVRTSCVPRGPARASMRRMSSAHREADLAAVRPGGDSVRQVIQLTGCLCDGAHLVCPTWTSSCLDAPDAPLGASRAPTSGAAVRPAAIRSARRCSTWNASSKGRRTTGSEAVGASRVWIPRGYGSPGRGRLRRRARRDLRDRPPGPQPGRPSNASSLWEARRVVNGSRGQLTKASSLRRCAPCAFQ
jgi:hypothetical protein